MDTTTTQKATKLCELGYRSFDAGRFWLAERAFRMLVVVDPDSEDGWMGLGSSLARQERHQEAAIIFGLAATLAPDDGWPSLLAAESLIESAQPDKALDALRWFEAIEGAGHATPEQVQQARSIGARLRRDAR